MASLHARVMYTNFYGGTSAHKFTLWEGDMLLNRDTLETEFIRELMTIGKSVKITNNFAIEEEAGAFRILPNQVKSVYFHTRGIRHV